MGHPGRPADAAGRGVRPCRAPACPGDASRLSGPVTPEQRLREVFGLTAAEARLAAELVAGKTLDDVSEERQVSLATVRSQLRSVFQKTETGRQAQLMQLITSLPDISDA